MRTRKKNKVDTNLWLNTYADMITLVLVFFILLFSMSSIDQEKYRMLVRAFTADRETIEQLLKYESELGQGEDELIDYDELGDIELEEIDDLDELYVYLRGYVQENDLEASVKVHKGENVVYVRFMSNLFFEPNRAVLKPGGREILDHVGVALAQVEHIARFIRIDGHTAEASPGNDIVNNRDLSTERANAVLKYLEDNYIKDPAKLFAVGYGLHRPVAPNDSEENRAKNRRVEILVGKQDLLQEELEKFYEMTDF
jgi:chemotaxis protein MotB